MDDTKRVGIIGGSGLYEIEGLEDIENIELDTPFGSPSDTFFKGKMGDVELIFLPRHGRGHKISPAGINSRANIYGFKKLGVTHLISVSAVGSMKEEIAPGDIVFVDQFIDRTKATRAHTFFGEGVVSHVSLADPVCPVLNDLLSKAASNMTNIRSSGTYITIDGPQFSTRAESNFYRMLGVDVIGMTASPEYKLAREAEMHFAVMALSTDYDCWKEDEKPVTVDVVLERQSLNVKKAKSIIRNLVPVISSQWGRFSECSCGEALKNSIITDKDVITDDAYAKLELFISKYVKG